MSAAEGTSEQNNSLTISNVVQNALMATGFVYIVYVVLPLIMNPKLSYDRLNIATRAAMISVAGDENWLRNAYWDKVVEHPFVAVCMFVFLAIDGFIFDGRFTKIVLSLPARKSDSTAPSRRIVTSAFTPST